MLMRYLVMTLVLSSAVVAGGCRQEDRGRPAELRAGVYLGEPMPTLTAEQVKQLQARGNLLR